MSTMRDRLLGVTMLPMQSVELAIEEMRYARKALGMRGGFLRPNPYNGRMLHHRTMLVSGPRSILFTSAVSRVKSPLAPLW